MKPSVGALLLSKQSELTTPMQQEERPDKVRNSNRIVSLGNQYGLHETMIDRLCSDDVHLLVHCVENRCFMCELPVEITL